MLTLIFLMIVANLAMSWFTVNMVADALRRLEESEVETEQKDEETK